MLTKANTVTLQPYTFLDNRSPNVFFLQSVEEWRQSFKTVLGLQKEQNGVLSSYMMQMLPYNMHQAAVQYERK